MQAMFSATCDSSIFQVSFDPAMLTSEPPEGFDLSYAPIEDLSNSSSWLQPFDQGFSQYNQQQLQAPEPQLRVVSDEITPQQHAEMMQYLNFNYHTTADDPYAPGPSSRHSSSSHSVTPSPVDPTPSYVPPTGAYAAGRRVVAGSWRPLVNDADEEEEAPPIQHPTQWGVRVIS
jgi:hypothetical protein